MKSTKLRNSLIIVLITMLTFALTAICADAGSTLSCDPQAGATHYRLTWTTEAIPIIEISPADAEGTMQHDISLLPVKLHTGYAQAGKEWLIREGPAADQLGVWAPQQVYTWSDPTYFEIDGGHANPVQNIYAIEDAP